MLKKIRIILASLSILVMSLLFLDFTGTSHKYLSWISEIQFWPAVLALNVAVLLGLIILTLIFGRIYCSVICPLGITQDIISFFSERRKGKKARFSYSKPKNHFRYPILIIFILVFALLSVPVASIIEPYSAFGRIAQNILSPLYVLFNNLLAFISEKVDSYAFYRTDIIFPAIGTLLVAILTFTVIAILSWKSGRSYCNTICPVGTFLGLLSRFSLMAPRIDISKCVGCGICERKCKSSSIDSKRHKIDYSRCVSCMNCLESCSSKAITYGFRKSATDKSRRKSISILSLFTLSLVTAKADGGLAKLEDKKPNDDRGVIVPPGAVGSDHFFQHCVACQQCVTACPSHILRPSSSLETFMQPTVAYENGYCRIDCNKCSQVCPTDAIRPLTLAQKSSVQIGTAVWLKELCIVTKDGKTCGNCYRHCPTGAISMIPLNPEDPSSLKRPVIDESRCIGCGACENLCPSRPQSAIFVKGFKQHHNL